MLFEVNWIWLCVTENNYKLKTTQPETTDLLQVVYRFYRLAASCEKFQQVCWLHQVAASLWKSDLLQLDIYMQTWCKLFQQLASSLWIKSLDLQQTCYHQTGASDANASWYRLDDCKATIPQQNCCNLRYSGCVPVITINRECDVSTNALTTPCMSALLTSRRKAFARSDKFCL